ncbi:hypothetical protein [Halolamina salifodinae]|uniref:Uncharacterized protein n=1 Tax=Halolamina salifodinae TaxID=1202767 RepID=A0A8T4GXG6_9EURY|nr:hypothetical protein [Halolamina salifodinae]MBP1986852.1 hypothetical protein [Halolamina salifodinae]
MKQFPPIPAIDDASASALSGHLWLLEAVEGSILRFQLRDAGRLRFGSARGTYRDFDAVPPECRRAVRHVRERLDREALRGAVDEVSDLTFVGWATHRERIDYDWARLPPFLGLGVWSAESEAFRPPDAVEGIYERLGLHPANAFERERNSRDFDPEGYTIPESAWSDGPAAGVVVRDKSGGRVQRKNSGISTESRGSGEFAGATDAESLAAAVATDQRFQRVADRLRGRGWELSVDVLQERTLDDIYREEHGRLFASEHDIDRAGFRAAIATRAQQFLGD